MSGASNEQLHDTTSIDATITFQNPLFREGIATKVCCGVRDRALASHTDVRGFEPYSGGTLSSLTC